MSLISSARHFLKWSAVMNSLKLVKGWYHQRRRKSTCPSLQWDDLDALCYKRFQEKVVKYVDAKDFPHQIGYPPWGLSLPLVRFQVPSYPDAALERAMYSASAVALSCFRLFHDTGPPAISLTWFMVPSSRHSLDSDFGSPPQVPQDSLGCSPMASVGLAGESCKSADSIGKIWSRQVHQTPYKRLVLSLFHSFFIFSRWLPGSTGVPTGLQSLIFCFSRSFLAYTGCPIQVTCCHAEEVAWCLTDLQAFASLLGFCLPSLQPEPCHRHTLQYRNVLDL